MPEKITVFGFNILYFSYNNLVFRRFLAGGEGKSHYDYEQYCDVFFSWAHLLSSLLTGR